MIHSDVVCTGVRVRIQSDSTGVYERILGDAAEVCVLSRRHSLYVQIKEGSIALALLRHDLTSCWLNVRRRRMY